MRVLGDDRVGGSLDENQGGGRTSKEPERDVAKRMVCFGQAADDVRESGHDPGNPTRFMKMAYLCRPRGQDCSPAVVPLQRVQGHEFPGTTRDVHDFRECDAMVSLLRDLEHMTIDPSRGADKDGKSGRRPLG